MSSTTPHRAEAPARAFVALQAQARRAPEAFALHCRQQGQWRAWSWQRLAAQAALAARGWASLGVEAGSRIVALGPLSPALIVTLFAADALGAEVVFAPEAAQAPLLEQARFAVAEGPHELERLLRHRSAWLRAAVVAHSAWGLAAGPGEGAPLFLFNSAQLLALGRDAATLWPVAGGLPPPQAEGPEEGAGLPPPVARHRLQKVNPFTRRPAERVLADFPPGWSPGLDYLLHDWPARGSLLLIPEPEGDALADRRAACAEVWLAPAERLADLAQALQARLPGRGWGARAAHAVLQERSSPLASLARRRMRAGLGLAAIQRSISDAAVPQATQQLLAALGIRTSGPAAPVSAGAARGAAAVAPPSGPVMDPRWVAAP